MKAELLCLLNAGVGMKFPFGAGTGPNAVDDTQPRA